MRLAGGEQDPFRAIAVRRRLIGLPRGGHLQQRPLVAGEFPQLRGGGNGAIVEREMYGYEPKDEAR